VDARLKTEKMKLTVLASGSKANCYVLQNENTALIIEAGVPMSQVYECIGYNIKKVVACLVSHEHKDHCKYVGQYLDAGIDVFASSGTIEAIDIAGFRKMKPLIGKKVVVMKEWSIMPFDVEHDCNDPFGFLIYHNECGNLLFATDTYYLKYRFDDLNHILIECNYQDEVLKESVEKGLLHPVVRRRTLQSHMSLRTCIKTLAENKLSNVVNIVLLHLSSLNSDEDHMKTKIGLNTGKRVFIAKKGLVIDINKDF